MGTVTSLLKLIQELKTLDKEDAIYAAKPFGRHPDQYHKFVLRNMERASKEANGDPKVFLKFFEEYVKEPVLKNPDLLNKSGW